MRVMIIRKATRGTGANPSRHELLAAISQYYLNELASVGTLLGPGPDAAPSRSPVAGAVAEPGVEVYGRGRAPTEIASLAVVEVDSVDQALEWWKSWSPPGAATAEIEIRPLGFSI